LAQAIGQAAIQQGYKVLYRETHILLDELAEAVTDGTRREYMESITTVPLLIIDGAIKVMRLNGEQLGFIPAHVSRGFDPSGLASQIDRGDKYGCRIKDLTGGGEGMSLGVNIEVMYGGDEQSDVSLAFPAEHGRSRDVPPPSGRLGWLFVLGAFIIVLVILAVINK
jgi:hypothetical protein